MADERFDERLTSAKLENQKGNFIGAQQICEELLQQKPNDFNVINVMAESFFKCGNHEKSLSFLEMANNLNPNSSQTLFNIAANYWKLSKYDLAKHYFFEAALNSGNVIDTWGTYAEVLAETNEKELAEYVYIQILKIFPDSYTLRNKYGEFLRKQNRIKNAEEQFKISQKSAPDFEETLSNLGDVYFLMGEYDKAILNYQKALKVNPNQKMTLCNLGKVYLQISEYQKAVDAFEKGITFDPENAPDLRCLAIAYCHLDNILMCVVNYKKCLKLLPDDFDINFELAMIYFHRLSNYQEAEKGFKKCIELNPQREDLYKCLCAVLKKLKKPIEASDIFMKMGDLYLKKFDLINARNAFTMASYLNPENADCHWNLGLTFHKLGHYKLAMISYKRATSLVSNLAHP